MGSVVYRSRIDWWLWAVMALSVGVIVVAAPDWPWWLTAIYGVMIIGAFIGGIGGCWYAVDGDKLVVYQFFRPHPLPINKISEVRYCTGYLAGPACSTRRLSIKFSDRKVLKSFAPLEISPRDRDGFVAHLLRINPEIKVYR